MYGHNKSIKIISGIISAVLMCIIFIFSAQDGGKSADTSNSFVKTKVISFICGFDKDIDINNPDDFEKIDMIVRKCAHFSEYALLGAALSVFVSSFGKKYKFRLFLPFCVAALYAVSDEIHQYFVPQRSCQIRDMLIDSAGALTGIIICIIAVNIIISIITRTKKEVSK